ncbi:MAG: hypothetical protein NZ954_02615 [Thermofilaceae archaeon]|nr:hypothetical protein [Thermofilaceae archaeon]MCX8181146.1 hypothetical protein [Thermofilaceae archaeon]MDW8004769.1 hypothetical protein [Thermofilaceae archaeon]
MNSNIRERRLRIRRRDDVPHGQARVSPKAMEYLGIKDSVEVVVGGKRKFVFNALALDKVPENEVWCNADEMRELGIADNTIAAVRAPLSVRGVES